MQLTPDPPFVGLATMTFLGQPKVEVRTPNILDRTSLTSVIAVLHAAVQADAQLDGSATHLELRPKRGGRCHGRVCGAKVLDIGLESYAGW